MFTTCARIEILVRITGKVTQTFHFVFHRMRMDNIHNNGNTHLMSSIDQCFQLIGSTKAGRSCKKAGNMITKTTIIRMFLNSHNLNTVIAFLRYTRKYFFAEFIVSTNLFLPLCHSDMTFINQQRVSSRLECFFLELIWFFRCPDLCTEYLSLFILYYTCSPGRNTFTLSAIPINVQLIQVSVLNGICRKIDFPITIFQFFQLISRFLFPIIECTHHIDMSSIRCPFTERPSFGSAMQAKVKIA